jgi:translation elongation factor EF-Tu-like GTPase
MMTGDVFVDLIDRDPQPPVVVRAILRLLRTEEGGRRTGVRSGYRPNHNFGGPDDPEFYIGQIDFESGDIIEPGDSRKVVVRFISGPGLREKLQVGRSWRIQEGYRLVGEATVLEVRHETQQPVEVDRHDP